MAPSFGRSISFSPLSPARSFSKTAKRHVRSISLPTSRTHPLLAHLHNTVRAAQPASPSAGLAHIEALHAAIAELLLLPEARAAASSAGCLLDGFLALADAYGSFQDAVIDLKRHAADVHAALRRGDAARLASAIRAQRHADKDIARLASSLRGACTKIAASSDGGDEVSALLAEAMAAVFSASAAVFSAVEFTSATAASAAAASSAKKSTTIISLVKRKPSSSDEEKELAAFQRLQHLHDCVANIQDGTDKVFRTILNTRVALLNIQTRTC